jgi:hypothetical protein
MPGFIPRLPLRRPRLLEHPRVPREEAVVAVEEVVEVEALLQPLGLRPRRLLQQPMVRLRRLRQPVVEAVPGEVAQVAVEMGLRLPRVALLLFR